MKPDNFWDLMVAFVLWLLQQLISAFTKYWMQEGMAKPITNKMIKFWKGLKLLPKISDRQVVMVFYLVMAVFFAGITLQVSATEEHDFMNRVVSLLGTITTYVYVMFFGLVYANVKPR